MLRKITDYIFQQIMKESFMTKLNNKGLFRIISQRGPIYLKQANVNGLSAWFITFNNSLGTILRHSTTSERPTLYQKQLHAYNFEIR